MNQPTMASPGGDQTWVKKVVLWYGINTDTTLIQNLYIFNDNTRVFYLSCLIETLLAEVYSKQRERGSLWTINTDHEPRKFQAIFIWQRVKSEDVFLGSGSRLCSADTQICQSLNREPNPRTLFKMSSGDTTSQFCPVLQSVHISGYLPWSLFPPPPPPPRARASFETLDRADDTNS